MKNTYTINLNSEIIKKNSNYMKKLIGKRSIIDFVFCNDNNLDYISYTKISDIFRAINDPTGRYTPGIYLMPFSKNYLIDSVIALRLIICWVEFREKDPELLKSLESYLLSLGIISGSFTWCDYMNRSWENIINDFCPGINYKNDNLSLENNWLGDVPEDLDELPFLTRYNQASITDELLINKLNNENIQLWKH